LYVDRDPRPDREEREQHGQYRGDDGNRRAVSRVADPGDEPKDDIDDHHGHNPFQTKLRARNATANREQEFAQRGLHVFLLDKVDLGGPLICRNKVDDVAVRGMAAVMPVCGDEIIAFAVMAADRAGIRIRIEGDNIAPHFRRPPNFLVAYPTWKFARNG